MANIKLKLKKHQVGVSAGMRYDVKKLKDHNKQVEFQLELRNRSSALQNREEEDNGPIESYWEQVKTAFTSACKITHKSQRQSSWIRPNKSCTDQIATLRIILEQASEFNSSSFHRFQKAFDSLDREVLWQLMRHYGIPDKFISIINNTYSGMQSKNIHEGKLTELFEITTGVRQGCLLSPLLFL